MSATVIGVDPHKQSHTAVVVDDEDEIAAEVRVVADRRQIDRLLGWAGRWPQRLWAIENVNGFGKLLAQQLVERGETVVDVPASLVASHPQTVGALRTQDRRARRSVGGDRGSQSGAVAASGTRGSDRGAAHHP